MEITPETKFKSIIATFFLCYIGFGMYRCYEEGADKVKFEEFNTPVYDFPFSIDSVANAITAICGSYHLWLEERNENFFKFQKNKDYNWSSYIYLGRKKEDKRIREYFSLSARLDSLGEDLTRVTIEKRNNEVYYGVRFWKDFISFSCYLYKTHPVDNPSIHEHEFLRLIGKKLGCLEKMPFTKYPKIFSQKDILILWGKDLPFTVEELFEHPKEGLQEWYQQNKRAYGIY